MSDDQNLKRKKNKKKLDKSRVYSEEQSSRNDILEESQLSYNSDYKKNDNEKSKLEIIEEETKQHIEEMKKGTYKILVKS